jgi:pterin-4a-carbinolamine dehydratase
VSTAGRDRRARPTGTATQENSVIQYQTLIETAGSQADVADSDEARRAVEAVIGAVAVALDEPQRGQLTGALPGALRSAADVSGPAAPVQDEADLVRDVSNRTHCPPQRARRYTHAVLATLSETEPNVAQTIARQLPLGEDLFEPIVKGVTPRSSGVSSQLTPRLLEPDDVARELRGLTGWEGDERRLRRTVVLPADRVRPLRDAVGRAEQEMTHHARVEEQPGAVTFEVWTRSIDRVTDLDVELARRINEAVEAVGSAG